MGWRRPYNSYIPDIPEGSTGYGKWKRATIIKEFKEVKPGNMIQTERRKAGSANPRRRQEEAERGDNSEEERVRTPNNLVLNTSRYELLRFARKKL